MNLLRSWVARFQEIIMDDDRSFFIYMGGMVTGFFLDLLTLLIYRLLH
ncbi:hypothetical protein H6F89_34345 [Cyanobacteria bacterium FACHB-63]|nr:hypothetical protein [Cyanobacteria bacterium FACHB-63]